MKKQKDPKEAQSASINKKTPQSDLPLGDRQLPDEQLPQEADEDFNERFPSVVPCEICRLNYLGVSTEMTTCSICPSHFCLKCLRNGFDGDNGQYACCACGQLNNYPWNVTQDTIEDNGRLILDMDFLHENISQSALIRDDYSCPEENKVSFRRKSSRKASDRQSPLINCINCKKVEKVVNCFTCFYQACRNSYCLSCMCKLTNLSLTQVKKLLKSNPEWKCFICNNNHSIPDIQEQRIRNESPIHITSFPSITSFTGEYSKEEISSIIHAFYNTSGNLKDTSFCEFFFSKKLEPPTAPKETPEGPQKPLKPIEQNCYFCEKKQFDANELLRFTSRTELINYIKNCFMKRSMYLCYRREDFSLNKEKFALYVKQAIKPISLKFKVVKVFCKLCFMKLLNCPNLVRILKEIFKVTTYKKSKEKAKLRKKAQRESTARKDSKGQGKELTLSLKEEVTPLKKHTATTSSTLKKSEEFNESHQEQQLSGIDDYNNPLLQLDSNTNNNPTPLLPQSNYSIEDLAMRNTDSMMYSFQSIHNVILQIRNDLPNFSSHQKVMDYDNTLRQTIEMLLEEKTQIEMVISQQLATLIQYSQIFNQLTNKEHSLILTQLQVIHDIYRAYQSLFRRLNSLIADYISDINRYLFEAHLGSQFKC